jgi:hypothetical protein
MKGIVAVVLSLTLATAGCTAARAQGPRVATRLAADYTPDPALMASYIRQLPVGSRVRVSLAGGRVIHATLIKSDGDPIVVQKRTRIAEPPLEISIKDVQALELEAKNGGAGRAIAMGAAAGAGAALGVLLILAAIFAGD